VPDVVIVGGGIVGCATAYYLAREGAGVTVIERGEIGGEASGAAAGMLAALSGEGGERGPAFDELCAQGLASYGELLPALSETGIDVRHYRRGVLHVALGADEAAALRAQFDRLSGFGVDATWLDRPDLVKEEPQLSADATAGFKTDGQWVDPLRVTQALAESARRLGSAFVQGAAVARFRQSGGRVSAVQTRDASVHGCDALLLAAGPWTGAQARRLGANLPTRPVRGQMLSLQGPPSPLGNMIWGEHAYLVPREDGQTYVGATVEEAGFRKRTTIRGLAGLRRGAAGLVPSLATAPLRRAWAGLRPASLDGLPVMGLLPGWSNVWVSTGHFRNGILMAPAAGRLVARSILNGRDEPALAPFSPRRFSE
jgi:glycine oxidase